MSDPIVPGETVLLTGASGRVGTILRAGLGRYWRLRLFDRDLPADHRPNEDVVQADIGDPEALARAAQGCAAVVHLAAIPTEAPNDELLAANAAGTYHVLQAAVGAGCRRFVFASTNHVTGGYPATTRVRPEMPPRPDGLYGASKVYGEALCRLQHDACGLEVAVVRIGSPLPAPSTTRHGHTWLSHPDMIELFRCCLSAPSYGWVVAYGASANRDSYWDDAEARERLGYRPADDASTFPLAGPEEQFQGARPMGRRTGGQA